MSFWQLYCERYKKVMMVPLRLCIVLFLLALPVYVTEGSVKTNTNCKIKSEKNIEDLKSGKQRKKCSKDTSALKTKVEPSTSNTPNGLDSALEPTTSIATNNSTADTISSTVQEDTYMQNLPNILSTLIKLTSENTKYFFNSVYGSLEEYVKDNISNMLKDTSLKEVTEYMKPCSEGRGIHTKEMIKLYFKLLSKNR